MAYFAKINNDNLVENVVVTDDTQPNKGLDWLQSNFPGNWIECFEDGGKRKNFASVGGSYDPELDAFIAPKPFDSWTLNKETAQWEAPVEYPTDGKDYVWNEETISWDEVPETTD